MRVASLVAVAVLACGTPSPPPAKPPVVVETPKPLPVVVEPGFDPPQPALRLPRHFTPVRYTARLAIDPAQPAFDGEIAIEGTLDRRSAVIWLHGKHLDIAKATATRDDINVPLTVTAHGDLLEVRPKQPLDAGAWTLAMTYRGQIDQNGFAGAFRTMQGTDPYVVTQFESTAARLVFPCIDEPDRKTQWQLTLDVPKDQVAVSNTPEIGRTPVDPAHVRIAFAPTRALPSYLAAFAVGPFEIVDAGLAHSGLALRVVTPRGTVKKVAFLASSLPRIVDILEAWFEIPFPYPKLDIVVAPSLRGGAMENAGMITTDSRIVMRDKPSAHDRYSIISVIGHETAHQWFGDLVTAAWWDDIWLNEGLATWIEDKILAAFDPAWPLEVTQHRVAALQNDELLTARKIRQPITNEGDIHNAFDAITYPKAAFVLRMIEHDIGEAKFRTAIHRYLLAHADGNATAADLFAVIEEVAPKPIGPIATSFFEQAGAPEITMTLACDNGGAKVALAQRRFSATDDEKPPEQRWTVPVCVVYETAKHGRAEACTQLDQARGDVVLDRCPAWFAPAGNYGYYRSRLDTKALEAIRDRAWPQLTPEERVQIYGDLYTHARAGRQPIALVMAFAAKLRSGATSIEVLDGLGDGTLLGFGNTTGLPPQLERFVANELRPTVEARVRTFVEPLAKKLGIMARGDEDYASESLRLDVHGPATWSHSHVLDAEAKRLVAHYRDLPTAVRGTVLTLAANADPKVAEQLHVEAVDEHDPELRDLLIGVVAGLEDPKRHHAMLEALLSDPKLTAEDVINVLLTFHDEPTRADNEAYVRAHLDAIMKRLPSGDNEDFPMALSLSYVFVAACDSARRDEIADYVTKHFGVLPTADRPVKQAIEVMDHCIARKKLVEPSLRAWLGAKPAR